MALNYFAIFTNSLFAGTVSVIITQVLFFVIARIFNYDFIFPVETGRNLLGISEDFYSDFYAGIRGFLIHIGIGLLIMFFYSMVLVNLLGIFLFMGPYTYSTDSTAILENVVWLVGFGFVLYLIYFARDKNDFDRFSLFFFLYLMCLVIIMAVLYGLYLLGNPGVFTFRSG